MVRKLPGLLLLAALAPAPAAFADMAVSCFCGGDNQVRLYWIDRNDIVRAGCDEATTVYDHATCTQNVVRVPFAAWLDKIDAYYGSDEIRLLRRRDDALINISRVDLKIDEYLARDVPTAPIDQITADLARVEASRSDLVLEIQDYEDQVARIGERLRQAPNPDLQRQSAQLSALLQGRRATLASLDAERSSLRRDLVGAHATLGALQDFQDLVHMRSQFEGGLRGIDASLAEATAIAASALRLEGRVFDRNFTWGNFNYSRSASWDATFAAYLEGYFRDLLPNDD